MAVIVTNATGWSELYNGDIVQAVYVMFDTAFAGWAVVILFFVFQVMLYLKTRNPTLSWVTGLFFVSLFAISQFVKPLSLGIISLLILLELAGILYFIFFK